MLNETHLHVVKSVDYLVIDNSVVTDQFGSVEMIKLLYFNELEHVTQEQQCFAK